MASPELITIKLSESHAFLRNTLDKENPPNQPENLVLWNHQNPDIANPGCSVLQKDIELNFVIKGNGYDSGSSWTISFEPDKLKAASKVFRLEGDEQEVTVLWGGRDGDVPWGYDGQVSWVLQRLNDAGQADGQPIVKETPFTLFALVEDLAPYYRSGGVPIQLLKIMVLPTLEKQLKTLEQWIELVVKRVHASIQDKQLAIDDKQTYEEAVHCYRYDIYSGSSHFVNSNGSSCYLDIWLENLMDKKRFMILNCFDQSALVQVSLALGIPFNYLDGNAKPVFVDSYAKPVFLGVNAEQPMQVELDELGNLVVLGSDTQLYYLKGWGERSFNDPEDMKLVKTDNSEHPPAPTEKLCFYRCDDRKPAKTKVKLLQSVGALYKKPFGFINQTDLVGWGTTNSPFVTLKSPHLLTHPAEPAREFFTTHKFVHYLKQQQENVKLQTLDACAGPVCKPTPIDDYLTHVIDKDASEKSKDKRLEGFTLLVDDALDCTSVSMLDKKGVISEKDRKVPKEIKELVVLTDSDSKAQDCVVPVHSLLSQSETWIHDNPGATDFEDTKKHPISIGPDGTEIRWDFHKKSTHGTEPWISLTINVCKNFDAASDMLCWRLVTFNKTCPGQPAKALEVAQLKAGAINVVSAEQASQRLDIFAFGNVLIHLGGTAPIADIHNLALSIDRIIEGSKSKPVPMSVDQISVTPERESCRYNEPFKIQVKVSVSIRCVSFLVSSRN